jgi:hypothetical protein
MRGPIGLARNPRPHCRERSVATDETKIFRETPNTRRSCETRTYVGSVQPVGYPSTALICGSTSCDAPALIWLEADEKAAYDRGERVFKSFTDTMKVRAI